ncbi:MAG: delta 1-pyrroline-5-carboxylate synthetase [Candidatus Bathyarchaeota archaeon]|nr:delta 1-pyrroline-5-carboxylate synthetase [Candidatus Bathyarchaeota archaeon]
MDAVIKVGGSLAEMPDALKALCTAIAKLATKYKILIVPGGGKFADVVREYDRCFKLPPRIAHRLAIMGMDQYGIILSELIPDACLTEKLENVNLFFKRRKIPVFLPTKLMSQEETLETSWDVTSDSIAAFIAEKIRAKKVVLVTDVDGIFAADPKQNGSAPLLMETTVQWLLLQQKRTSVDKFLPKFLLHHPVPCYVVNGKYPERIGAVLSGQRTVCTLLKL